MNIIDEIKASFKTGSVLTKLIYVNLAVFVLLQLSIILLRLFGSHQDIYTILSYLAVPADLHILASKPWTLLTYMFTHKDFLHILFNLLWLFWFGKIFLSYYSEKQLLSIYFLGGIAGGALYVLSYNIFPGLTEHAMSSFAMGASASVMAIVFAIAFLVPDYKVYVVFLGPVKIIYIALVGFALSSLVDFSINTGGKIAHIGGAAFGYYFTYKNNKGNDITIWFSNLYMKISSLFRPRKKMKVTHKKPVNDFEYNKQKAGDQKEVDRILDKISKSGYDSLTTEEKEILFKMSK